MKLRTRRGTGIQGVGGRLDYWLLSNPPTPADSMCWGLLTTSNRLSLVCPRNILVTDWRWKNRSWFGPSMISCNPHNLTSNFLERRMRWVTKRCRCEGGLSLSGALLISPDQDHYERGTDYGNKKGKEECCYQFESCKHFSLCNMAYRVFNICFIQGNNENSKWWFCDVDSEINETPGWWTVSCRSDDASLCWDCRVFGFPYKKIRVEWILG